MKSGRIRMLGVAVGALLVLAGVAMAGQQGGGRWNQKGQGGKGEDGGRENMMVKMMANRLKIDDTTVQKVVEVMKKQREAQKATREEMEIAQMELKVAIKKNASDAELNPLIDKVVACQAKMMSALQQSSPEIRNILGARKYAELLLLRSEMMERMREGGGHQGGKQGGQGRWNKGGKN